MTIELAPRLNLITGDNGLGKTFLLDVAWWVLTRTWAGEMVLPTRGPAIRVGQGKRPAYRRSAVSVAFELDLANKKKAAYERTFDRGSQQWRRDTGRPPSPGLILYARVDGGFCVWDPARNYGKEAPSIGVVSPERPPSFIFDTHSVWEGLKTEDTVHCKGLLQDWVDWQKTGDPAFSQLEAILAHLSPRDGDLPLKAGSPMRLRLGDVREMPTLAMPYGDVPIQHASAAMRRIAALAYLLVWSFREHVKAQEFLGKKPERRIIFLIDEIEAHLHPRWQRAILPALFDVTEALAPHASVQIMATTHSPFVPLSVETMVDEDQDACWDLDLLDQRVALTRRPWERRGDIAGWATSDLFDLPSTRSVDGEKVIADLQALYRRAQKEGAQPSADELDAIEARLRAVLPELDPIFGRWRIFKESLAARARGTR